ncbi:hypothetical protein BLS_004041 [Venturia inaequalis]|uniref:Uncharacterized protein n=1 Tax=Venturia inaequalis TaxID=5025 RepID=A0A8H3V5J4_VENIN|nr:hypothetical protein BLS_004041 [Venturia inaequalis]KAE9981078.1 hypothetical protein EG328_011875 [Venturia inaequalis]
MYSLKFLLLAVALFGLRSLAAPVVVPGADFTPRSVISPVPVKREPQNNWAGNGITGKRYADPQNDWAGNGITGKREAEPQNNWAGNGITGKREAEPQNNWAGNGITG